MTLSQYEAIITDLLLAPWIWQACDICGISINFCKMHPYGCLYWLTVRLL